MNFVARMNAHNTTLAKGRNIAWIVIHFTAGTNSRPGAALNVAGWFKNPTNTGGSADFIVDDSTAVQYNPDVRNRYTWAVGGKRYPGSKGGSLHGTVTNRNSISVEICSTSKNGQVLKENDPGWSFTDAVLSQAVELVQHLMKQYGVDAEHVVRHYDVSGKLCPGIVGWNKESGSEAAWRKFRTRLSGSAAVTAPAVSVQAATAASASASAQSDNTESVVWDFLRGKGLSDYAVAGIMGNLYAESSLRANNLQDSFEKRLELSDAEYTESVDTGAYQNFAMDGAGYGLCQWTWWTRKRDLYEYAKAADKSVGDLTLQLDFLWKELQSAPPLLSALSVAASVQEASNAFLFQFERPADMGESVQRKRAAFGQVYYDRYALPYLVRVTVGTLNVRSGPGTSYPVSGSVKKGDAYTVTEIRDGFGKLKSGAGWIALKHTERTQLA